MKAVRNDDKQSEIKGRDKNKPLKSSPQISKISSPQLCGVNSMVQLFLSTIVPAPTAETNSDEEASLCWGTQRPWPSDHLLLPRLSPPRVLGNLLGNLLLIWSPELRPCPGDSDPKHPDPQPRILHFHKAPPTGMVTRITLSKHS